MTIHHIRAPRPDDREVFLDMWREFVDLAPDEPGDREMGARNWSRLLIGNTGLNCILAVDDQDQPLGFTLYLAFPFTWSRGDVCYLQDIYVRAEQRGKGVAQAMIGRLAEIGRQSGWYKIFWMTQPDNFAAQRLYDKVTRRMDYIRYDVVVGEP